MLRVSSPVPLLARQSVCGRLVRAVDAVMAIADVVGAGMLKSHVLEEGWVVVCTASCHDRAG